MHYNEDFIETFVSYTGRGCNHKYIEEIKERWNFEQQLNNDRLKRAYKYLCELLLKDGYLVYGDIYKAFDIDRKDDTNNKFCCGDYDAYVKGIKQLIAKNKISIEGLKGNRDGFLKEADRYSALAERENNKMLKMEEQNKKLSELISISEKED